MKFLFIVFSILVVHCIEISNGDEDPGSPGPPEASEALKEIAGNSSDASEISQQIVKQEPPTVKSLSAKVSSKKPKSKTKSKDGKGDEETKKKKKKSTKEKTTTTTTTTTPEPPKKEESEEKEDSGGSGSSSNEEHKKLASSTERKSNDSESLPMPEAKLQDSPKDESEPVPEARMGDSGPEGRQSDSEKSQPNNVEGPNPTRDDKSSKEATIGSPAQDPDSENQIGSSGNQGGPQLEQRTVEGGYGRNTVEERGRDSTLAQRGPENDHNDISPGTGVGYPGSDNYQYPNSYGDPNRIPNVIGHISYPNGYPGGPYLPGQGYDYQQLDPYGGGSHNRDNRIPGLTERLGDALDHGGPNGPYDSQNGRDPSRSDQDTEHYNIPGIDVQHSGGYKGPSDGGRGMLLPPDDGYPDYPGSGRGPEGSRDPQQSVPGRGNEPPTVGKGKHREKTDSESDSRSNSNKDSQDSGNAMTDYDTYDEEGTPSDNVPEKQQENRGKGQSRGDQSNLPDGERQGNNHHNPDDNEVLKNIRGKQHTNTPNGQHMGTHESGHLDLKGNGLSNGKDHKYNNIIQHPGGSPNFPRTDSRMYPDQDYDGSGLRNPEETRQRLNKMVENSNFGYGRRNTLWDRAGDLHWNGLNNLRGFMANPPAYLHRQFGNGWGQGFGRPGPGSQGGYYPGGRFPSVNGRAPQTPDEKIEVPDENAPLSWKHFKSPEVIKRIFQNMSDAISKMKDIPQKIKEYFRRLFGYLGGNRGGYE